MIKIIKENVGKDVFLKIHIGGEAVIIDAKNIIDIDTDLDNGTFHIHYKKKEIKTYIDDVKSITFSKELHSLIRKIDFVEVAAKKGEVHEIPL